MIGYISCNITLQLCAHNMMGVFGKCCCTICSTVAGYVRAYVKDHLEVYVKDHVEVYVHEFMADFYYGNESYDRLICVRQCVA